MWSNININSLNRITIPLIIQKMAFYNAENDLCFRGYPPNGGTTTRDIVNIIDVLRQ